MSTVPQGSVWNEPCAVQHTFKGFWKKGVQCVRKSPDDLKLANVVKTKGDRKENII